MRTPEIDNRKAYFDYEIEDTLQCGIELKGLEVKSLRCGAANLKGAWCSIEGKNLIIHNMYIASADSTLDRREERADRKLLAHKDEIRWFAQKKDERGYSIVPLKCYFKDGKVKILIGLARGKKQYDKRQTIKARDLKRERDRNER